MEFRADRLRKLRLSLREPPGVPRPHANISHPSLRYLRFLLLKVSCRARSRLAPFCKWHEGCGPSPATRAVIWVAAPAPAPASQDPRCRVPAASRRPHLTIRRPGSTSYNSVLWPARLLPCHGACEGGLQTPHPRARWGRPPKTARTAPVRRHPSRHLQPLRRQGDKIRRGRQTRTRPQRADGRA